MAPRFHQLPERAADAELSELKSGAPAHLDLVLLQKVVVILLQLKHLSPSLLPPLFGRLPCAPPIQTPLLTRRILVNMGLAQHRYWNERTTNQHSHTWLARIPCVAPVLPPVNLPESHGLWSNNMA